MRGVLKQVGRVAGVLAMVLMVAHATGALALAQAAAGQPGQQQEEFVPVKDLPQQEQLPAAPLLVAAYAFVWVALLVYVWTIWRRLLKVEREMQALAARITR